MRLQLDSDLSNKAAGKLAGKAALIAGGDSGIGRAVALAAEWAGAASAHQDRSGRRVVGVQAHGAERRWIELPI